MKNKSYIVHRPFVQLRTEAQALLEENILPYWLALRDTERGGFYARVDAQERVYPDAPRGAILYARILWAFSAAYRVLGKSEYLEAADWVRTYIEAHMFDSEYGGVYWSVSADGRPLDTHKQFYAQAFMLYAYTEYYRATRSEQALSRADELFHVIEQYGRDKQFGGYVEAASRTWLPVEDNRLSDKDENTVKSQNTNLHVLEAYTNYYRVRPTTEVRAALQALIETFQTHIILPSGHLGLFFDEQWHSTHDAFSAGHDIECSWLIDEAAHVLSTECNATVEQLASAAVEGLHPDGSIGEQTWWEQAEAVVGFINAWQRTNNPTALNHALAAFDYIRNQLVDYQHGEWYWTASDKNTPDTENDKAGFWKCPYHNSRMCLELIERSQT